ncbi:hypothetical protein BD410DRAFT_847114 [Rickenella mellea]|uniref:Secreted protein n=1 Tax=Rickenella mellea TaxID=50990 RepID=A0A4Y7PE09_9AGAM|nr:hypothetical protein BD410DRAFT_847114 [Rickenella mellea]
MTIAALCLLSLAVLALHIKMGVYWYHKVRLSVVFMPPTPFDVPHKLRGVEPVPMSLCGAFRMPGSLGTTSVVAIANASRSIEDRKPVSNLPFLLITTSVTPQFHDLSRQAASLGLSVNGPERVVDTAIRHPLNLQNPNPRIAVATKLSTSRLLTSHDAAVTTTHLPSNDENGVFVPVLAVDVLIYNCRYHAVANTNLPAGREREQRSLHVRGPRIRSIPTGNPPVPSRATTATAVHHPRALGSCIVTIPLPVFAAPPSTRRNQLFLASTS